MMDFTQPQPQPTQVPPGLNSLPDFLDNSHIYDLASNMLGGVQATAGPALLTPSSPGRVPPDPATLRRFLDTKPGHNAVRGAIDSLIAQKKMGQDPGPAFMYLIKAIEAAQGSQLDVKGWLSA